MTIITLSNKLFKNTLGFLFLIVCWFVLANILGSTISKNEKQIVNDVSGDFVREYTSEEINEIHQQGINNYRIVYQKSFMHKGKFRSFVVIEMSHNV